MGHEDDHGGYHNGPSGSNGRWARGDHFDRQREVIGHDDWDRYHLHAPPPGYEWVRSGDQFIMIAIASGIIASIIAGSIYGN
ncbi:MAG: RcnB family protein [Rhodospirillales bacterium]|nr:RcnB family protein [Rhodospirillales bacterium]